MDKSLKESSLNSSILLCVSPSTTILNSSNGNISPNAFPSTPKTKKFDWPDVSPIQFSSGHKIFFNDSSPSLKYLNVSTLDVSYNGPNSNSKQSPSSRYLSPATEINLKAKGLLNCTISIISILVDCEMQKYLKLFNEMDISLKAFLQMTKEEFRQMGIKSEEDCVKLEKAAHFHASFIDSP